MKCGRGWDCENDKTLMLLTIQWSRFDDWRQGVRYLSFLAWLGWRWFLP